MTATLVAVVMLGSCAREKGASGDASTATGAAVPPVPTGSPVPSTTLGTGSPAAGTPLDAARARAAEIESRASSFRPDSGTWSAGDASSTYTVLLDGKQPVIIEEKLSLGERGASFNRFVFENGRLFFYQERGIRTSTNRDRGYPMTVESKVEVEIAFDSAGKVVGARYAEDGREGKVPETKVTEALARGGVLIARLATSVPTNR